ncbi:thiamine phosphate synthase [Rhodovulum euryhalinum]|uniref:Thiamine-phosphate synthase n=1 Tax=Rhodovulum euryhalinum TaxID=35805 RepID=A0A4R2KF30_9RHOB|nr:thiamine phosphate synthase [Rhodovulum euryhalinum]TCO71654.1 thiamine-phosphate diphosphorylase [Rhodovulum euryhalinum]
MTLSVYFVTPDGVSDALVLAAARGGATAVQLRDKCASDAAMIAQARRLKAQLAPLGVPLIVNDRLPVALAAGADGLHIGQSDGDPARMRAALGPDAILGLSIETEAQLAAVPPGIVDYLGVGPVRATATKPDHATPLGLDGLARIVAAAAVPAVAIGGVGAADISALKAAGCAGIAVVSTIAAAPDPGAAAHELALAWRHA